MRKVLLVLILPFLVMACGDELFDIAFAYDFNGNFEIPALDAGQYDIDSESIKLSLLDELEERKLASVTSATLERLQLEIPELSQLNWDFVESAELFMLVDGKETPMASIQHIPTNVGKLLEMEIKADEFKLIEFLDAHTAQARLRVNLRSPLAEPLKIDVLAATKITASAK